MGRSGAMLPMALAVLTSCVLPRGRALQKFEAERAESEGLKAELGAERAELEAELRAERAELEAELRAERAERAQTRVRVETVGSLEMLEPSMPPPPWAEQVVPTKAMTLKDTIANRIASDPSMAEMKRALEEKIAAINAQENEKRAKENMSLLETPKGAEKQREAKEHMSLLETADALTADGIEKKQSSLLQTATGEGVDRLVLAARQAGKARLEEAKRIAKEAADRWAAQKSAERKAKASKARQRAPPPPPPSRSAGARDRMSLLETADPPPQPRPAGTREV